MRRSIIPLLFCPLGLVVGALFISPTVHAKDFGVQGHTQPIKEKDLIAEIMQKLFALQKNGSIGDIQEGLKEKTLKRIKTPKPVLGLQRSFKRRIFKHDPTITVPRDIVDHEGNIIHSKGKRVNPLDHRTFKGRWIFIEGTDERQVEWALKEVQQDGEFSRTKIILVNGSPFDLSEKHKVRFYFDQLGKLTEQLTIKRVPSLMYQCGRELCIEEIPVEESKNRGEGFKETPSSKMIVLKSPSDTVLKTGRSR